MYLYIKPPSFNPYDENCPYKYHAIIYLFKIKQETYNFIAKLFGYAESTIRSYTYKYSDLLEESKNLFEETKVPYDWRKLNNPNNYDLCNEDRYFYLIKFYDKNHNFLVSKIGTTTRSLKTRLKEHFKSNTPYSKMGADYLIINKVYKCNRKPEGVENFIRGLIMKKYDLIGNDQFAEDLDWSVWDKDILEYIGSTI